MSKCKTIYLDHAATSYPKPAAVEAAMVDCLRRRGGNPGRGSHRLSLLAAEEVFRTREVAAALFGAQPERVIFTLNTTHALNTVIKGVLGRGGHAVCSDMEHNSVLRPLHKLAAAGVAEYDVFETFPLAEEGRREERILASLLGKLRPDTRLVICAHASNICSASLPIERIGALCRRRGIFFAVDGAQSAGAREIDMERMFIDALCVPGHKGLLGPQGTGMLILGSRFESAAARPILLDTLMEGGNGMDSLEPTMSEGAPERYEAGTVATPAIAGLRAGMEEVLRRGVRAIGAQEARMGGMLRDGLMEIPGVTVYAPRHEGAVVLFSLDGRPSEAVGARLDEAGICVRPGFHCSALGHRTLGTPAGGAVRASVGPDTRDRDVEVFLREMRRL